ncbi:MAG: methyltransferase domain-containing protein [Bryobacteraceae bacterium]
MPESVAERMRDDWNRRATEDAHYYVAFGRRNQDGEEFFDTAREQVLGLELELKRLPPADPRSRRALEIGCGPGRLMRPMSRHFGEIHGVDISDRMVARARENLAGVPHAHPHHAPNSNLEAFASNSFDFVYSYAVFQHIPSREVVLGYLDEAQRILKPGGILRCQLNGLPQTAKHYDTWSGVRIPAGDVLAFARERGLLVLAMEGIETQYMWTTMRKPPSPFSFPAAKLRIRRVTNAYSSEPIAPVSGRFAALSLWVEGLPADTGLNEISVEVGGKPAFATYLGHPEHDSLQQLNVLLPEGLSTGAAPVRVILGGDRAESWIRLMPAGPRVPKLLSVTDGVDLMSGTSIVNGVVKMTVEEVIDPATVQASISGVPVVDIESFRTDPRLPRWELNFQVPAVVPPGPAWLEVRAGARLLGRESIEIGVRSPDATIGNSP